MPRPHPPPTPPPAPGPGPLAIRHRFKETKPNHRDCFGDACFSARSGFGTIIGWRITGDLSHTAAKLQGTLIKLITEKRADWQSCRPKNDQGIFYEPSYTLESFLIGLNKAHASPYITIISSSKWFGSCLRKIILESNILLAQPDWSCFRLPARVNLSSPDGTLSDDKAPFDIYTSGNSVPNHQGAVAVEIRNNGRHVGNATIGGFLIVGDTAMALSAAHVFYPQGSPPPETSSIDDSDLDLSETSHESEYVPIYFPSPPTSPFYDIDGTFVRPIPESQTPLCLDESKILIGHLCHISTMRGMNTVGHPCLDWALITITHSGALLATDRSPGTLGDDRATQRDTARVLTPSGPKIVNLVPSAIFGLPIDALPQPVFVGTPDSTERGDSGSWAFRGNDIRPIGMLIGNCQPLNQCYILGMDDILADIEAQTGLTAKLSSARDASHPKQLADKAGPVSV